MVETRYAQNGEQSLAYQVVGDPAAPPLLFVPGFVSNLELQWEHPSVRRFLDGLSSSARLILFDKRGTGLSDRPADDALPRLDESVDDVRAVLDAAGVERASVFAVSEGGPLASAFAASHPDRTDNLVLYGAYAKKPFGGPARAAALAGRAGRLWGSGQVFGHLAPSWTDEAGAAFLARYERHSATPSSAARLIRRAGSLDVTARLADVRSPALVLHRRDDCVVAARRGRELAAALPDAEFVELPGEDHWVYAGDTEPVLDKVLGVLGRRWAAPPSRVFAGLVFVDIVDSTGLAAQIGDRRLRDLLDQFHTLADRGLRTGGGDRVSSFGDGLLASFPTASAAVRWATELRREVAVLGISLRSGVHAAEVERRGGDLAGVGLHVAARVASSAEPGEVLVTRTVRDLLGGSCVELVERGTHLLRGVNEPWALFAVRQSGSHVRVVAA